MLPRLQCDIVRQCAEAVERLTREMSGEPELFASRNTLAAVEAQLLTAAQTLAHLPAALQARLAWVDWRSWGELERLLADAGPARRDAVWYAVRALLPATVHLIEQLRRQEPAWFDTDY